MKKKVHMRILTILLCFAILITRFHVIASDKSQSIEKIQKENMEKSEIVPGQNSRELWNGRNK
ncbi:MAG: hypothetical protein UDG86_13340 [Lachnospiraceae bacterium]|nr:hypothetical protein [Lachnospiraceae bacterium]